LHISDRHLLAWQLNKKTAEVKSLSTVWRSATLQIHDFAPPPHNGFAFSGAMISFAVSTIIRIQ
jgi:hypothetical protein